MTVLLLCQVQYWIVSPSIWMSRPYPWFLSVVLLALSVLIGPADAGQTGPSRASAIGFAERDRAPWDGPASGLRIPAARLGGASDSWI